MISGYKGISFPFRITNRGGVAMSTTNYDNPAHIAESIEQILSTEFLQRPMESDIYSNVSTYLFEPDDISLQQVLKTRMVEDITRLEPRVDLEEDDIEFSVETENDVDYLYATIVYKVIKYQTTYTSKVKVGEL